MIKKIENYLLNSLVISSLIVIGAVIYYLIKGEISSDIRMLVTVLFLSDLMHNWRITRIIKEGD